MAAVGALLAVFELAGAADFARRLELEIGEGAGDDLAKHGRLLVGRAIEPVSWANSRPIRPPLSQRTAHSTVPFSPR